GPSAWLGGIDLDDRDGDPISTVSEFGFDVISPDKSAVTADFVRRAHESGVEVIPYTVDDPALMVSLVEAGVDGFITNYPDRARLILDGPSAIEV
ncbi:MAG TPA: glycerophosphodiester phosphodiesterase family protein, partial [Marmoricola sp.]|nr:glycerophosphodiester phosphodiesterase family protein [Marmoricola sp.]